MTRILIPLTKMGTREVEFLPNRLPDELGPYLRATTPNLSGHGATTSA
jgi:hypothetical protein